MADATAANNRYVTKTCSDRVKGICQFDYDWRRTKLELLRQTTLEDLQEQNQNLKDFRKYFDNLEPDEDCDLDVGMGANINEIYQLDRPFNTINKEVATNPGSKAERILFLTNAFIDDLRLFRLFQQRLNRSLVTISHDGQFLCVHEPGIIQRQSDIGKTILKGLESLQEEAGPVPHWIGTLTLISLSFLTVIVAVTSLVISLICGVNIRDDKSQDQQCQPDRKSLLKRPAKSVAFKEEENKENDEEKKDGFIKQTFSSFASLFSRKKQTPPEKEPEVEMSIVKSSPTTRRVTWQTPNDSVSIECPDSEVQPLLNQILRVSSRRTKRRRKTNVSEPEVNYPEMRALLSVIDNPKPSAPPEPTPPPYSKKDEHSDSESSRGSIHPFQGVAALNQISKK